MSCLILDADLMTEQEWRCCTNNVENYSCVREVKIQGEALSPENIGNVYNFVSEFKRIFPEKKVALKTFIDLNQIKSGSSYLDLRRQCMLNNYVDEILEY